MLSGVDRNRNAPLASVDRQPISLEVDVACFVRVQVDDDLRKTRRERRGSVTRDPFSFEVTRRVRRRRSLQERAPGGRKLSLPLVAVRQVDECAAGGIEALAFLELGTSLGGVTPGQELLGLIEECLGGDLVGGRLRGARFGREGCPDRTDSKEEPSSAQTAMPIHRCHSDRVTGRDHSTSPLVTPTAPTGNLHSHPPRSRCKGSTQASFGLCHGRVRIVKSGYAVAAQTRHLARSVLPAGVIRIAQHVNAPELGAKARRHEACSSLGSRCNATTARRKRRFPCLDP